MYSYRANWGTIESSYGQTVNHLYNIFSINLQHICDMAISPDGNVLATAGQDGHVKFWQIDLDEPTKEPV